MKKLLFASLLCFSAIAHAQCSPFGGVGNVQFLDNSGNVLTNGVLYAFQAGTSTQQATFTDSTCTVTNVNPITFGTGARVAIWLTTANLYKFVLCVQNDGSSCAASDVLFSVDNVPGGVTGGGGGGGAPFISNAANPATSGILRLASGDSICWRNTAISNNLCFKKDTNDLLSWDGGSFKLPEVAAPTSISGFDIFYADSTAHRYKQCSNGSACAQVVNAGNDINTTDAVTAVHFSSTQETFGSTAPTTNQVLLFNGTGIVGQGSNVSAAALSLPTRIQTTTDQTVTGTTMTNVTGMSFAVAASTNYSATCYFFGNAVTAGVAQFQWTGPAAPTSVIYGVIQGNSGLGITTNSFGGVLAFNATTTQQIDPSSFALINGANAGTVQLQINNSTGGDGALLKAGSYCIVQ